MSGETKGHRELKRAGLFWAQVQGYRIAALEVRVPSSPYRADVAGYNPAGVAVDWDHPPAGEPEAAGDAADGFSLGKTMIMECKQARPDFLNDSKPLDETMARLKTLYERCEKLERQLGIHFPNLRSGDTLFPDYQGYEFGELNHKGYRKLVKEIRMLKNRVYGKTKFERLVRYQCANLYYLVTAPGIVEEHELPTHWGWLEVRPDTGKEAEAEDAAEGDAPAFPLLELKRKPTMQQIPGGRALALLHRLGLAGTRQFNREEGIQIGEIWGARRRGNRDVSTP